MVAAGMARPALAQTPAQLLGSGGEAWFSEWLNGFYARALAAGYSRDLLDRELSGLSPDPRVSALDAGQPEYARPVSDYVMGNLSAGRLAAGRARRVLPAFAAIEARWGVPRDILLAVWAMESGFGAAQGDLDIIRCLATLAALGRRRAWAEEQLRDALDMVGSGVVSRARLRGSWAGAMGQTQILPSVYLADAVTPSGGRGADIWGSSGDALATAANLLNKAGWRRGEGWTIEVVLPRGFDYGLSEGPSQPFAWWAAKGVRRAGPLPISDADAEVAGILLLPSGAAGPAFLALPNHYVIRAYNNSIAYALTIGFLADRFAGRPGVIAPWPRETPLSLSQRMAAQSALARLGFNPGSADGMVGAATRAALRAWQKSHGLPADGYLSPYMVERLRAAAAKA
jgi:lytic murein transglycosylase